MKTIIFGAIALTFAVPAFAQTAPAPDPHAQHKGMDHSQHAQGQQHQDHAKHMEEMHKKCQDMMKQHGKMDHGAKPGAPAAGDHAGH